MSKSTRRSKPQPSAEAAATSGPAFQPPMSPSRRRLFVAAALFAVWLGLLLTLYFVAVFPEKQKKAQQKLQPMTLPVSR